MIFKLLGCVVTFQEFGFSKRALSHISVLLSNEKFCFLCIYDVCSINETENNLIGCIYTMSWNQYNFNLCSPSTMVFSYAKIVNYLFTKKRIEFDYIKIDDDNMNFLFEECIKKKEDEIPNSLLLFIQMYKKKIFLPKTNMSIVDSIFRQFFNFLLSSGAKGGKYLTSWSEALDGNQFKNLIFQNLQISFIVHYSNTEFHSDLKTLLKEDPFPDLFEIADVFKINFFATIFNKQSLLKETDDIIREIPKSDQILSKLILFNNLKNTADENELNLLDCFIEKEKINFSENYEDCIKKSYSYCILPSYILSIFNEKKLHYIDSHYMILYLLDVGNSFVTGNECLEILSHFDQISYNDACELNSMFNTQEFLSKFKSISKIIKHH